MVKKLTEETKKKTYLALIDQVMQINNNEDLIDVLSNFLKACALVGTSKQNAKHQRVLAASIFFNMLFEQSLIQVCMHIDDEENNEEEDNKAH